MSLAEEVLPDLRKDGVAVWLVAHASPHQDFRSLLLIAENTSDEDLNDLPQVDVMSNFLFIFTSGTTGTAALYSKRTTNQPEYKIGHNKVLAGIWRYKCN